jgi:hypothetical protein
MEELGDWSILSGDLDNFLSGDTSKEGGHWSDTRSTESRSVGNDCLCCIIDSLKIK